MPTSIAKTLSSIEDEAGLEKIPHPTHKGEEEEEVEERGGWKDSK